MRGKPHKQHQRTPRAAQQQFVLRALVGSLVVCATLGVVNVPAYACGQHADIALVRAAAAFQSRTHARRVVHVHAMNASAARADHSDPVSVASLGNMTPSASGKQLSPAPGMSREQAGNLLRQNLALP
jgi:hypothetical protein